MSSDNLIFISVVLPCYNEEAIIEANVNTVISYLEGKKHKYKWEILIINDGSKDRTGELADKLEQEYTCVRVIHHHANLNLGHALQTGFRNAKGDVIVVLDLDMSYSVDHIELMVDALCASSADVVVASPYMKGGKVTAVPFTRKLMSKWVNKLMSVAAQETFHTFTGMVRAYRKEFIRYVNLKTTDYEINPEIMYKSMILRARIVEVPAHLDWSEQNKFKGKRTSSLRVIRGLFSGLMSAFIFRPYFFFVSIGAILLALSLYQLIWLLADTLKALSDLQNSSITVDYPFSYSLAEQFKKNPQTFLVGGITFIASIQFLSLGFLSLQSKRYFDELFHLGTSLRKLVEKKDLKS
jgi:glycosyltransferase involved in cell wall biosynthesis